MNPLNTNLRGWLLDHFAFPAMGLVETDGHRTRNPLLARQVLSRLSYSPMNGGAYGIQTRGLLIDSETGTVGLP